MPASLDALVREASERYAEILAWHFIDVPDMPYARITYRDLGEAVDRYAAAFGRAGIGSRMHVAVMLPNVPAFPLTWLALARLGAVIVPLNPAYTAREIEHVVAKSQATHMVVDGERLPVVETARSRPAVCRIGLSSPTAARPPRRSPGSHSRLSWLRARTTMSQFLSSSPRRFSTSSSHPGRLAGPRGAC
jgi:acyl-CoA synthetase (AMP-forming)/AMP-acid ligase II